MKYRHKDEFDKVHRCVIVIIEDDIPHAWAFWLYLILFKEIESGLFAGSMRYGSWPCESGALAVFIILISIHLSFAIRIC